MKMHENGRQLTPPENILVPHFFINWVVKSLTLRDTDLGLRKFFHYIISPELSK